MGPVDDYLRWLKQNEDMLRRFAEGPIPDYERLSAQLQKLALPDFGLLEAAARSLDIEILATRVQSVTSLTEETIARFAASGAIADMELYARTHADLAAGIERAVLPYHSIAEHVHSMSAYAAATRFTIAGVDFDRVGALVGAAREKGDVLARLTDRLALRHADLIASLSLPEGRLASQPAFVSELPTRDLYVHSAAIRSITPHDRLDVAKEQQVVGLRRDVASETQAFLEATLPELKSAFLSQYQGAKHRAIERGPDWWTQGGASMRKLLKGVLHTAAPNEVVAPWAVKRDRPFDKHGRPTRATKIEWLCEPIKNKSHYLYVRTELTSALALIDLIDVSQHVDDFPEFEAQYDWAILRAEMALRHILTLWTLRRS